MSGKINLNGLLAISVIVTLVHTYAAEARWEDVVFYDDAVVASDEIYGSVTVYDSPPETTTIEFYGRCQYLTMYDSSTLNLHEGGKFEEGGGWTRLYDSSTVNVYEGAMIALGSAALMNMYDLSTLNIYGGIVSLFFFAGDSSTINLYDGDLGSVTGFGDNSILNVYAGCVSGWIENFYVGPTATVNIYGYDFEYTPHGRWMPPIHGVGEGWWVTKLTGYGFEGDPITFWGLPDPETHDNINLIPEPTTLLLLGLGGLGLLRICARDMTCSG